MIAIFFDLDNTIYDSRQYFLGALNEISGYLAKAAKLPRQKIYQELTRLWQKKTSFYPYLFDDLLKELNIESKELVKEVVNLFNGYRGRLKPYPGALPALKKMKKLGYKLGIITDGNVKRQQAKISLLGIKDFFEVIIYTKKIRPKPSKKSFLAAVKKMKINPKDAYYVADNPLVDFKGAKEIGMKTARLLQGEFKSIPKNKYIDYEIKKFSEILNLVK